MQHLRNRSVHFWHPHYALPAESRPVRVEVLHPPGMGSGLGRLRRVALYLWHTCHIAVGSLHGGSSSPRRSNLSYRVVPTTASCANLLPHRTACRHPQRRLWPLGGLCSCTPHARCHRSVP